VKGDYLINIKGKRIIMGEKSESTENKKGITDYEEKNLELQEKVEITEDKKGITDYEERCLELQEKAIQSNERVAIITTLITILVSSFVSFTVWYLADRSDEKTNEVYTKLAEKAISEDIYLKRKLNHTEQIQANSIVAQSQTVDKMKSLFAKQSNIIQNISDSTNKYAQTVQAESMLSQPNIKIECTKCLLIPKEHIVEMTSQASNHMKNEPYVIFLLVKLVNKSKYPVNIMDFLIETEDLKLDRTVCGLIAVVASEENMHILVPPFLAKLRHGDTDPKLEKMINTFFGDIKNIPQEFPMFLSLSPFESRWGFLSFHTSYSFAEEFSFIKLKIDTNRGMFEENVRIVKDPIYFQPLSRTADLIVLDKLKEEEANSKISGKNELMEYYGNLL